MIQNGERLQFVSSGDETKFPFVQLDVAAAGQENSPPLGIPVVRLDGGPFIKKVQITTSGNPARIPKVRIPHLAAWFKFSKGITVTGAGVSQWDDQSGNGRHLKQGTDTNRPALQADGSILFDGVDNYLKCDAFTLNQPETVYFLGKQVTWTNGDRIFDGDGANSMAILQSTTTPRLDIHAGSNVAGNTGLAVDAFGVLAAVYNGASSLLQVNNNAPTTGNAGVGNAGGFTLGAVGTVGSQFANIQVKEVLIYSTAHDDATRAQVIRYLASVGGLSF